MMRKMRYAGPMNKITKALLAISAAALILTGCSSAADTTSYNLSEAAENFEIERRVTAINGITGEVMMEIEGRCSIESGSTGVMGALEITCRIGPDEYVKHFVGLSDNVSYIVQQLETADASIYHHRVIIRPENLLPEFSYEAGEQ